MTDLKPCTKYLTSSPGKQLRHIISELLEVIWAFILWRVTGKDAHHFALMVELTDLQTTCQTFLYIIAPEPQINLVRQYVVSKNKIRGYYSEKGEPHDTKDQ